MADILSQSQIDALLRDINSGDKDVNEEKPPESKEHKTYDFKSPKKFTKEQLKTMDSLHESVARGITTYLSSVLRSTCEVNILTIEEQRYYEYNNAISENSLLGMIEMEPTKKDIDEFTIIMDLSTPIGYFMIDRLLGGSGEKYNLQRNFTSIEIDILRNVYDKFNRYVGDAWREYIDIDTSVGHMETNARLMQAMSMDDIVVIVILEIKVKDLVGNVNFCIPAIHLEQMMMNFTSKYARAVKKGDEDKIKIRKTNIMNTLLESELDLIVILDKMQLGLNDIMNLQINDIISLNVPVTGNVKIEIESIPWFEAKLGETKLKKAIQIRKLM